MLLGEGGLQQRRCTGEDLLNSQEPMALVLFSVDAASPFSLQRPSSPALPAPEERGLVNVQERQQSIAAAASSSLPSQTPQLPGLMQIRFKAL